MKDIKDFLINESNKQNLDYDPFFILEKIPKKWIDKRFKNSNLTEVSINNYGILYKEEWWRVMIGFSSEEYCNKIFKEWDLDDKEFCIANCQDFEKVNDQLIDKRIKGLDKIDPSKVIHVVKK